MTLRKYRQYIKIKIYRKRSREEIVNACCNRFLPGGLDDAGDLAGEGEFAEAEAGEAEFAVIAAGTAGDLAAEAPAYGGGVLGQLV